VNKGVQNTSPVLSSSLQGDSWGLRLGKILLNNQKYYYGKKALAPLLFEDEELFPADFRQNKSSQPALATCH